MAAFVVFVEYVDTEPDPLPVYFVDSEEHAARICEGIGATEYRAYKFSFHEVCKTDLSKFPFRAEMTIDARDVIYGNIVAGIYDVIDRAHAIISQRRSRGKPDSGTGSETGKNVHIHALRHSFGTHLSIAGVAPRVAQAAMRHRNISLTMGTYTDARLLDTAEAVESLPSFLIADFSPQSGGRTLAPTLAPTRGENGQNQSIPDNSEVMDSEPNTEETPRKTRIS